MTDDDALSIRYRRMARARELCLLRIREHIGPHLPPPVVAAVSELAETMLRLCQTPDDELEVTRVGRRLQ